MQEYFSSIIICDITLQKYEERIIDYPFFSAHSTHFNVHEVNLTHDCCLHVNLFRNIKKRNSMLSSDKGFIILDNNNEFILKSFFGYFVNSFHKIDLKAGIYKIVPLSFRFWNESENQNNYNLVLHCSNTFSIKNTKEEIKKLPEFIFKMSKRRFTEYCNEEILDLGHVIISFGFNGTKSSVVEFRKKLINGKFIFKLKHGCTLDKELDEKIPKSFQDSHFTVSQELNDKEFVCKLGPRSKRILLIFTNYSSLKKKSNMHEYLPVNPKFSLEVISSTISGAAIKIFEKFENTSEYYSNENNVLYTCLDYSSKKI